MEYEYPLFNNIIDSSIFDRLSTSEKIQLLLQKDIFFLGNSWFCNEFYCQDFSKLDFSIFEKHDFCFNETYKIDGISIALNPLLRIEVFEGICSDIRLSADTVWLIDEINFHLSTFNRKKEKEKFLREKIAETNPFELSALLVEYNKNINKIALSPLTLNEIVLYNPALVRKWVTGEHHQAGGYVHSDSYLDRFYSSYQKFLIAEFCFNEISLIKKQEQSKVSKLDDIKSENNHPPHDPNLWNLDCFNLFKYLFDKYYMGDKRQTTNIWFFLKEYDPPKYTLKATKKLYKSFILESYGIKITNFDKSQPKYSEKERPTLNEHRKDYEDSLK